jgi:TonB family protein
MQSIRAVALAGSALLILIASPGSSHAQTGVGTSIAEWETLRPAGEEFEILMPKNSTSEVTKETYHKMTLTMRLYLSDHPSGAVFAVTSMSGIKSNPALYSEGERVNSYVDAFRRLFPVKLRGKEAVGKISLVGVTQVNGHSGRNYNFVIGDLSGSLQVFATRKRFYAIAFLNKKKDLATKERFLGSFVLPQKVNEPEPTVAADTAEKPAQPEAPANAEAQKREARAPGSDGSTDAPESKPGEKPAEAATANGQGRRPISGGILNGKAISLPAPLYSAEARAARASGSVNVQITIDEYGGVITARAVSGHPLLQPAAVNAALQARFSPTFLMGEAVKVTGVLVYNFVAQQ